MGNTGSKRPLPPTDTEYDSGESLKKLPLFVLIVLSEYKKIITIKNQAFLDLKNKSCII